MVVPHITNRLGDPLDAIDSALRYNFGKSESVDTGLHVECAKSENALVHRGYQCRIFKARTLTSNICAICL